MNTAALQIQAMACHNFANYFIKNVDSFVSTPQEERWVDEWRSGKVGNFLCNHELKIVSDLKLFSESREGNKGYMYIYYKNGNLWDASFLFIETNNIRNVLAQFLRTIVEFSPFNYEFNEPWFITAQIVDPFIYKIIDSFLNTYTSNAIAEWEKMGVVINYDNKY